jgi:hypothetical protein
MMGVLESSCNIARILTDESFRTFSARLADSPVLQKFCLLDNLEVIKVPGKSMLQRYNNWLPAPAMRKIINPLLKQAGINADLAELLDLDALFADTACVKANIQAFDVPIWNIKNNGQGRQT